jgi:hypothetical protein
MRLFMCDRTSKEVSKYIKNTDMMYDSKYSGSVNYKWHIKYF